MMTVAGDVVTPDAADGGTSTEEGAWGGNVVLAAP